MEKDRSRVPALFLNHRRDPPLPSPHLHLLIPFISSALSATKIPPNPNSERSSRGSTSGYWLRFAGNTYSALTKRKEEQSNVGANNSSTCQTRGRTGSKRGGGAHLAQSTWGTLCCRLGWYRSGYFKFATAGPNLTHAHILGTHPPIPGFLIKSLSFPVLATGLPSNARGVPPLPTDRIACQPTGWAPPR